jgi:VWFA-related protein
MKKLWLLLSFLLFVSSGVVFSQQSPAAEDSEIVVNVTVTDVKGKAVTGLDKNAFTVSGGKTAAEIVSFNTDEPAEVLFLFDISGGMSNLYRKKGGSHNFVSELLSRFMQSSHASNRYSLFAFRKMQEEILAPTNDQRRVLAAADTLDAVKLEGSSSYIDALYFGIEKLRQSDRKKRVLVLLTQVKDAPSKYTSRQLTGLLKENNVSVYIVGSLRDFSLEEAGFFEPNNMSGDFRRMLENQDYLANLTKISGGSSFYPRSGAEMAEIFSRIGSELRHQYTLEIKLAKPSGNNKSNRIKVKVKTPPGVQSPAVRNREEFFN